MRCCAGWANRSTQADIVDAACAISAPLDLARGGAALSRGFNMLYTRMFLQTLKPKCLAKLEQFPGLFDRDALLAARDLYEFDNVVTAPLHGYRDTDDYWDRASAKHVLHDITVPTLVLNARNDPFLPGAPPAATARRPRSRSSIPATAATSASPPAPCPAGIDWLPQRMLAFLRRHAAPSVRATDARNCAKLTTMDDIVKQAMAKWPNVPHCYGWLALDARGDWRMRDEARPAAPSCPATSCTNAALLGFINRNYAHDERGCWYFQNGPQRVYVNLEATPYIARTDPAQGLVLQTGEALRRSTRPVMTETGAADRCKAATSVAQVDDRDVAQLLTALDMDGAPVADEALLAWLEGGAGRLALMTLRARRRRELPAVQRIASARRWRAALRLPMRSRGSCAAAVSDRSTVSRFLSFLHFLAPLLLQLALARVDHGLVVERRIRRLARNAQLVDRGRQRRRSAHTIRPAPCAAAPACPAPHRPWPADRSSFGSSRYSCTWSRR